VRFTAASVHRQIVAVLEAWGMPPDPAAITADVMVDTDLAGIDSHGVSMLMMYDTMHAEGRLRLAAQPTVVTDAPAFTVLDGGHGLGHPVAVAAMDRAVAKARVCGVGAVSVRNSQHFGAAGHYARRAALSGLMAMVTSTTRHPAVSPTGSVVATLGTNPFAFAAPRADGRPFVLDMATSVVAMNKVKVYAFQGKPLPDGWVTDESGAPVNDAARAYALLEESKASLSPLGGIGTLLGGHKGFGLNMMVQILSAALSDGGSPWSGGDHDNVGHFFLAIDPAVACPGVPTTALVEEFIAAVKLVPTADEILVAGEVEDRCRVERERDGIPMPDPLVEKIAEVCARAGVELMLS
jgi:LDH2 family malate/lactate/ureidoglycolate dehydrogenase